jgi:hypothetical protein
MIWGSGSEGLRLRFGVQGLGLRIEFKGSEFRI